MAATLFLTCGSAGRAELKCSSYDAVYEPKVGNTISPNFSNMHMRETTYKLTLTVKPIPDVPGGWGPFAYLDLNTYGDDEELKSTFRMTFGCSGGSMPSCGASMPSSPPKNSGRVTRLEIAGLKRDFSSTGIAVSPNNAPYALIIPDARARFRYAHWGNMTEKHGMKYFTSEEKWHWPLNGGGIPEVWILTQCRAKKAKE